MDGPDTMLLLAFALAAEPVVSGEQYGFQDSKLGVGLEEWQRTHPAARCGKGETPAETQCITPRPDFLPRGSVSYSFTSIAQPGDPHLWKVEVIGLIGSEAAILDGLTGKWGKPHKYGLYADTWSKAGSTIRYMRLSNGGAAVTITDDKLEAKLDALKKEEAAKSF